jgi:BlaI family penicillinase repressor
MAPFPTRSGRRLKQKDKGDNMASPPHEKLTRREREIMNAIFALGDRASAEDVRARLTDPPSYSAVRAMLAKLEAKGYVRHREEGLRYIYAPTKSRAAAQRNALRNLVRVFFAGSPGQTATALLRQEAWTDEEIDALGAEIDRVRKTRRRP